MLSTWIIENYALVRISMLVGGVLAVVVAALLVRHRRVAGVIAVLALLVVAGLTLAPDTYPLDAPVCNLQSNTPLGDTFNIVLFVLPALFATVATRRPLVMLASGIGLSLLIETVQFLVPVIGRRCDIDDWIANSFGALAGVVLAVAVMWIMERLRPAPPAA